MNKTTREKDSFDPRQVADRAEEPFADETPFAGADLLDETLHDATEDPAAGAIFEDDLGPRTDATPAGSLVSPSGQPEDHAPPDGTSARTPHQELLHQFDTDFEAWLQAIKPGLGPAELGVHLYSLQALVEGAKVDVSLAGIAAIHDLVQRRMKECGYSMTKRRLLGIYHQKAKLEAIRTCTRNEEYRARQKEEGQDEPEAIPRGRFVPLSRVYLTPIADESFRRGIMDVEAEGKLITNFEVVIEEDLEVHDDVQPEAVFAGQLMLPDRDVPFRISAADYANDTKLKAALYVAGGSGLEIDCKAETLRNAIAHLSPTRVRRRVTTSFGWTEDGAAYLVPSGRITAGGFEPADQGGGLTVDLSACALGAYLDLQPLPPAELPRVKRHLVDDWLPSHARLVTYSLLGTAAAALLYPALDRVGRYALWLKGLTGTGKSFEAILAQHFFGDFRGAAGRHQTWASTANHIQMAGYYFRHALYLVDDYKPNAVAPSQQQQILRLLQTYSDNTARGRLRADASFQESRPIRGFLVSTGEDVPEHSASTAARSIIIEVPKDAKDLGRGRRCLTECRHYPGVTADFIRWMLERGYLGEVADRFQNLQDRYYQDIAGKQNDLRIANNFALLAAGFWAAAEYLGDVWPQWEDEARRFQDEDLVAVRDALLGEVRAQQDSEVFLATLVELETCPAAPPPGS